MLGVAYMVLGLIIINNHYFMPSLRRLSQRLRLSDDVAGGLQEANASLLASTACIQWWSAAYHQHNHAVEMCMSH